MKRRDLLAGASVGLAATLAGCLGDDDDDDGGEYPHLASVEFTTEAADLAGEAGITRQFTADQPAGVWVQLTNTGSSSIELEFDAWATPYFYRLDHDDDDEVSLVITDETNSPNELPTEETDGCWRSGFPPRQPETAPHTLAVDDTLTALYFIAAPTTADACVETGSYTSTYAVDVADLVNPITLELAVEFGDE